MAEPLKEPTKPSRFSIEFMHEQLADDHSYQLFNVIDDFKHEGVAIEAGFLLPTTRGLSPRSQLLEWR